MAESDLPADAIREAAMKGRRRAERQQGRMSIAFDEMMGTDAGSFAEGMQPDARQSELDALAKHIHQLPWPPNVDPATPDPLADDPLTQALWGKRPDGVPSPAALSAKYDHYAEGIERRSFDAATATEPPPLAESSEEIAQRLSAEFAPAPRDAGDGRGTQLTSAGLREMFEKGGTRGVYDVADALGEEFLRQHPDADLHAAEAIAGQLRGTPAAPRRRGWRAAEISRCDLGEPAARRQARRRRPARRGPDCRRGWRWRWRQARRDRRGQVEAGDMIVELGRTQRALGLY